MHGIESRFVIGPSNILFAGVFGGTFQPVRGWGSEGVNTQFHLEREREREREREN